MNTLETLNRRSSALQSDFIKEHGKVGKVAKSNRYKKIRYNLHKQAREVTKVDARKRTITPFDGDCDAVNRLIEEFGYSLQLEIE